MRTSFHSSGIAKAALALALAGCSASGFHLTPSPTTQGGLPMRTRDTLGGVYAYVDDLYGNFVDEFDKHGNLVAKLSSGVSAPAGLFVDASQNLWVANENGNGVLVFPPGSSTPSRTLNDSGYPYDVVVGPDGTAYVANIGDPSGYATIEIYPPGSNEPARSLQDPNASQNLFIAMDAKGNLFVTVFERIVKGGLGGYVDEYVGAQQGGLKRLRPKMGAPGGIRVHNGLLLICDTTRHTVREFTETGRATGRELITGGSWGGFDVDARGLLLGADQTYLQGIQRGPFPSEAIDGIYHDASFQYPVGAAFASTSANASQRSAARRTSPPQFVLLADSLNNVVDVFGLNGKIATTLTTGINAPSGLFVDRHDDLWVANLQNVTLFANGATAPSRTLDDPGQRPADVAVTAAGTVYVANFVSSGKSSYGPGSVSVYPPGHNTPARMLHDPAAQYDVSVASDTAGNVFTTVDDYSGVGYIDEFVGAKQSGFVRLPVALGFAQTIRFDRAGNLVVLDWQQHLVAEYTPAGAPTGLRFHTKSTWTAFGLSQDGSLIAGGEDLPDRFKGDLLTFPGHQRIRHLHTTGLGLIGGVAFVSAWK